MAGNGGREGHTRTRPPTPRMHFLTTAQTGMSANEPRAETGITALQRCQHGAHTGRGRRWGVGRGPEAPGKLPTFRNYSRAKGNSWSIARREPNPECVLSSRAGVVTPGRIRHPGQGCKPGRKGLTLGSWLPIPGQIPGASNLAGKFQFHNPTGSNAWPDPAIWSVQKNLFASSSWGLLRINENSTQIGRCIWSVL
jgi:hypothetical protein